MNDGIELTRRKILAGTGAVGLAGAGAGMGTSAYFSDVESFEDNEMVAGELDLKAQAKTLYFGAETEVLYFGENGVSSDVDAGSFTSFTCASAGYTDDLIIDLGDVKPGDAGIVGIRFLLCDNPGFVWLNGGNLSEAENDVVEPEEDVEPDSAIGELQQELLVRFETIPGTSSSSTALDNVVDPSNFSAAGLRSALESDLGTGTARFMNAIGELSTGNGILLDGSTEEAPLSGQSSDPGCFAESSGTQSLSEHLVLLKWGVPTSVGNEIQTDSFGFNLGFYTEQCRHNDATPTS